MAERRLDPERCRKAVAYADSLRAIIPRFGEQKAFVRITEPITPLIRREMRSEAGIIGSNRDRAVCALVNKACNTHAAVRVLTDAGHGDDAMALGRVLLENAALLQWLLIDPIYRLDLYRISDALYRRRWRDHAAFSQMITRLSNGHRLGSASNATRSRLSMNSVPRA